MLRAEQTGYDIRRPCGANSYTTAAPSNHITRWDGTDSQARARCAGAHRRLTAACPALRRKTAMETDGVRLALHGAPRPHRPLHGTLEPICALPIASKALS